MPSARKCSNARLTAAMKCSRRKTLVRETSKKSISKCNLLDSIEIPLELYRFSEPEVGVERKNIYKIFKLCGYFFSKLVLSCIDTQDDLTAVTKRLRQISIRFSFPGQFMLASDLTFCISRRLIFIYSSKKYPSFGGLQYCNI